MFKREVLIRRVVPALLCTALCGLQPQAHAATWYVAAGSHGGGTQAAPFGTIQDAADAARAGDLVLVGPGVYRETVTVAHSGTAQAPIVFRSQQPGAALVSGADPVGPFSPGAAQGAWRSGTVTAYTSAIGQAEQCFAGRTQLPEARWPYTPAAALSAPAFAGMAQVVNLGTLTQNKTTGMYTVSALATLERGALPAGDWTGAQLRLNLGYRQVSGKVTAVLDVAGLPPVLAIQYQTPGVNAVAGSQFFLYGVAAALGAPGQWLRSGQALLVRAPGDADPNGADIECKRRDFAFDLSGAAYVTLDGFGVFAAAITTDHDAGDPAEGAANWTLRTGQGNVAAANHIVLRNLDVDTPNALSDLGGNPMARWTNNTGVVLSGSYNTLQDSSIVHADGNGVSLAGAGNKVLNNRISESNLVGCECAGISTGYRGVTTTPKPTPAQWGWTWNIGEEIGGNTIERSGRALINISALASSDALPSRVHHNLLSGAVLQTYDNGAIYSTAFPNETAQVPQAGLEIDHNIITASPVGIYLDVYSSGFLIHHNIVTGPGEPGLQDSTVIINSGSAHQIYNNTLIPENADSYAIWDWKPVLGDAGVSIRNNILRGATGVACVPACQDHSLVWDGVAHSASDPHFHDAPLADLSLLAGSPALLAGIGIPGIVDDGRPGSQLVSGTPDEGAIQYGMASWVPSTNGDSTAPIVSLSVPADGASYTLRQIVKASYSCGDDGGSGVARCTGTVRNREAIDTASLGSKTFTVMATDRAGNNVTVTRHYSVSR